MKKDKRENYNPNYDNREEEFFYNENQENEFARAQYEAPPQPFYPAQPAPVFLGALPNMGGQYYMTDANGNPVEVRLAPQPCAGPVPIATPHANVQLTPIISPVAFVPYSTQNQPLYTFDDED
ncbi:MAG: hypothetical protein FWD49_02105 [Firmicutes bacterium]|nr:hypothetical protein [Bacillota bacterium]